MTRLRQRIAERLKEAQNTAAMLTTFNEINMQPVMELRTRYQERFQKEHGVKLGFMSFFTKAVCQALKVIRWSTPASTGATWCITTTTTSAWRSVPSAAWWCRSCATPTACRSPRSKSASPISANAPTAWN
jgi:hypothetical protein